MDNAQKRVSKMAEIRLDGSVLSKYMGTGVLSGNYDRTTNAAIPVSPTPAFQIVLPPTTQGYLEAIRAIVREELQHEQVRDRSGTVHICIEGQWYQGDLYPTEDEEGA